MLPEIGGDHQDHPRPALQKQRLCIRQLSLVGEQVEKSVLAESLLQIRCGPRMVVIDHCHVHPLNLQIHRITKHDQLNHRHQHDNDQCARIADDVKEFFFAYGNDAGEMGFHISEWVYGFMGLWVNGLMSYGFCLDFRYLIKFRCFLRSVSMKRNSSVFFR